MEKKFNNFKKAQEEAIEPSEQLFIGNIPSQKKEKKVQMSIMLTPSDKTKIKQLAKLVNMNVSELIAFWINDNEQ